MTFKILTDINLKMARKLYSVKIKERLILNFGYKNV